MVEHFLAKEDVARSNRVTRSTHSITNEGVLPNGGSLKVEFLKPSAAIVRFPEDGMMNITVWMTPSDGCALALSRESSN